MNEWCHETMYIININRGNMYGFSDNERSTNGNQKSVGLEKSTEVSSELKDFKFILIQGHV